eukprot:823490-Ditylum_brightwellii.AAC.1
MSALCKLELSSIHGVAQSTFWMHVFRVSLALHQSGILELDWKFILVLPVLMLGWCYACFMTRIGSIEWGRFESEVLQTQFTANEEPTIPIVSPMVLPPPPFLQPPPVEANKGEKVNPKGEAIANSTQEKQHFQMPKMIDLSTSGL